METSKHRDAIAQTVADRILDKLIRDDLFPSNLLADEVFMDRTATELKQVVLDNVPAPPSRVLTAAEQEYVVWFAWKGGGISRGKVAELLDFHVDEFPRRLTEYGRAHADFNRPD